MRGRGRAPRKKKLANQLREWLQDPRNSTLTQYCTGEGPLRTGPTVGTDTNAKERPVSRSTLVDLVSVCYYVTK